jgi:hypothetical protein
VSSHEKNSVSPITNPPRLHTHSSLTDAIQSQQMTALQRLRWSRGSVLAFTTQVRGFKPGRSRRIFKGEKILSTPSFGGDVKPSVPCRRFAACKRLLNVPLKSCIQAKLSAMILAHAVPPFASRGLSGNTDEETDWRRKWERLKH